jgi:hypothetical protein
LPCSTLPTPPHPASRRSSPLLTPLLTNCSPGFRKCSSTIRKAIDSTLSPLFPPPTTIMHSKNAKSSGGQASAQPWLPSPPSTLTHKMSQTPSKTSHSLSFTSTLTQVRVIPTSLGLAQSRLIVYSSFTLNLIQTFLLANQLSFARSSTAQPSRKSHLPEYSLTNPQIDNHQICCSAQEKCNKLWSAV